MSDQEKRVGVRINGVSISVPFLPEKTAAEYASEFVLAFEPIFPTFDFFVAPGGNLVVEAPPGVPLEISSYGSGFIPIVNVKSDRADEAPPVVIVVAAGVAGQTYRVSLNGQACVYTTGTAEEPDTWYVEAVAEDLRNQIVSKGFIVQRFANVLIVRAANGQPISFAVTDTWDNKAIRAYRGRVGAETELPPWLDAGTVLAVGDVRNGGRYVKYTYRSGLKEGFDETGSSSVTHTGWTAFENINTGVYEETYLPGTKRYFAESTMPHVLVRQADGTFVFKKAAWLPRQVGDETSMPAPSFVGKRIQDLFFFKNRLGVLCEDSLVFSKAGKFFDFWGETVMTVKDTDPVDVALDMSRITPMRYAVPYTNNVLLWGNGAQYVVQAQGALTPTTLSIQPTTSFPSAENVRPTQAGASLFFVNERSPWSQLKEYYVMQDTFQNTAEELTLHVPRYVPADVRALACSPTENTVVMLSAKQDKKLYVYQYAWQGDERVQQSFGEWTFQPVILGAGFIGAVLYLTVRYPEGVYLVSMDLQQDDTKPLVDRAGSHYFEDYTMWYQFSPVFLRDRNGAARLDVTTKYRNLLVHTGDQPSFRVAQSIANRGDWWRTFPDYNRPEVYDGRTKLRVGLYGDPMSTRIYLVNDTRQQTAFRGAEFELIETQRSYRR